MLQFKTEEEADEQRGLFSYTPVGFCPLLKGTCNTDCVCYVNAKIQELPESKKVWNVYPAYCINHMFFGV